MNAAPDGATRHGARDRLTLEWALQCGLAPACGGFERAESCHVESMSTSTQGNLLVSSLSAHWNILQPVFYHTTLMFRLPRFVAGLGYAGACRPLYRTGLLRRCRVDLKKLRNPVILSKWRHLLDISLSQPEDESVEPPDPFMTLKYAENAADDIAYSLAGGSTVLWLWTRLEVVGLFFLNRIDFVLRVNWSNRFCSGLLTLHLSVSKLPSYLRKIILCCPLAFNRPAAMYFTPKYSDEFTSKYSDELKVSLHQAQLASDVRWATILNSYVKENWRRKIAEADGVLDKEVLEATADVGSIRRCHHWNQF